MTELIVSESNSTTDEKYKIFIQQLSSLVLKEDNLISNLANVTAAFKQTFDKISWAGFYLYDGKKLYLGPFQGKVACTNIEIGKGVCGQAAKFRKTIIVPDVHQFPGHIFCDVDSKSEIVIPLIKENKLLGVLDLDSTEFNSFNEEDKFYLEKICKFLTEEIF